MSAEDFLAREQAILGDTFSPTGLSAGGGSGDIDFAASAFPDLDDFDGAVPVAASSLSNGAGVNGLGDGFGDFEDVSAPPASFSAPLPPPSTDVKVTGDEVVEQFESQYPDLDLNEFNQPQQSTYQPPFLAQPQSRPSFQTPVYQPQEEEPEVIIAWRKKQEEEIAARDAASLAKKRETIAKAEQSIDDFYKQYNSKIERNVKQNKDAEIEFAANREAALSAGTTWSRIADLVELQNSQSKTIARAGPGTTDLTRYKEVLLRLMREGESAPGAAGY